MKHNWTKQEITYIQLRASDGTFSASLTSPDNNCST